MSDSSDPGWLEGFDSGWLGSDDVEEWERKMLEQLEGPVEPGEVDEGQDW